jgi:transporter family protein
MYNGVAINRNFIRSSLLIMSQQTLGILIGGLIPALLYGVSNIFVKAGNQAGISTGVYLLVLGITIAVLGAFFLLFTRDAHATNLGMLYTTGFGITWGLGTACVALAVSKYKAPLATIVPLFNMNTLVAVILALWIFAEWKQVHVTRLLFGSFLIVIGGTLVAL